MDYNLDPYLNMGVEFDGIVKHLWLPAIAVLIALMIIVWFRKRNLSYLLCFFIFSLYALYAIDKVFFPIVVTGAYPDSMKQEQWSTFINFIPFYFGPYGTLESSLNTLILNIIVTIPLGFGINFLIHTKPKKILWIALVAGFGAEIIQLIISLIVGYPYRYIDINDVLMNALGVLIGYAIFRIFAWLYLWTTQRFDIQFEGLGAYIYDVAHQAQMTVITKPANDLGKLRT